MLVAVYKDILLVNFLLHEMQRSFLRKIILRSARLRLSLKSGKHAYANAGHDFPARKTFNRKTDMRKVRCQDASEYDLSRWKAL